MTSSHRSLYTALITGASSGIGLEFARQLAAAGHDLVIVARTASKLEEVKADLEAKHHIDVEVLAADLTKADDVRRVADRVSDQDRPIDILVNNAGFGLKTAFVETPLQDELDSVDVMVRDVTWLTHTAARAMVQRKRGQIINVSSVASFMASGSYSAAKAYVTVLSESLNAQLAGTGVTVTALCPGFTHTEFHGRAGINVDKTSALGKRLWLDADFLVAQALKDADAGKSVSVPGRQYKVVTALMRHVPRRLLAGGALSNRHRPRD